MANEQNLKPITERSKKEQREIQRRGGIASGKARRKKADLKKAFNTILKADVANENISKQLEALGFEATNEMALAMVMMQKAMKGNVKSFEQIARLVAIDTKDSLDRKEQRERIAAIQLENERRKEQLDSNGWKEQTLISLTHGRISLMTTIDIQKNVNPNFKVVWQSNKPYNVLKGGRNSFKSSVIVLKLVYMMIKYIMMGEKANVVVIRKVGKTIRDSVFNKVLWAISLFGLDNQFRATVSPFKIVHKRTGSTFYFYGQD
ncbi:MAG: phage terminase large subunit, partial [Streptococcus sp.]